MSFTSLVRQEISLIDDKDSCCRFSFLQTAVAFLGTTLSDGISIQSHNQSLMERIKYLIYEQTGLSLNLDIQGKTYYLVTVHPSQSEKLLDHLLLMGNNGRADFKLQESIALGTCCKRAAVRAAFLCCGTALANHLEFFSKSPRLLEVLREYLLSFNIESKTAKRNNGVLLYVKKSEYIMDIMAVMQANNTLLEYISEKIIGDMANSVNRQVNCETANLTKVIDASFEQIAAIKKIVKKKGWDYFDPRLAQAAKLRMSHKQMSLTQLAALSQPPISRSGLNHRLNKIIKLAREI